MMKNVIRKILFEESEDTVDKYDDELTSPEISISPSTELYVAQKKYSWEAYIPEIGKKIIFDFNPEHWNLFAKMEVEDVDKKGHGSFGDDSHKDYQKSILDNVEGDRYQSYYNKEGKIVGSGERYDYVDVKDAIKDLKGFTKDFKQRIQQLTKEYINKMSTLNDKYNFNSNNELDLVTVDSKGNYKRESDFEETGDGWYDQPSEFTKDYDVYMNGRRKI
jgi:hypothetical protein